MCVYVNRVFHLSEHANYAGGWFPRTTSPLTTSSSPPPPLTIYYSNPSVCFFQCQCSTFVKPLLLSHENQNGRVLNAQKQKMNDDDPLYEDDWLGSETVTSAPTKQNKRRKKIQNGNPVGRYDSGASRKIKTWSWLFLYSKNT